MGKIRSLFYVAMARLSPEVASFGRCQYSAGAQGIEEEGYEEQEFKGKLQEVV